MQNRRWDSELSILPSDAPRLSPYVILLTFVCMVPQSFVVDCLDSLLLFGLRDDYKMARDWVLSELTFDVDDRHHAFEVCLDR